MHALMHWLQHHAGRYVTEDQRVRTRRGAVPACLASNEQRGAQLPWLSLTTLSLINKFDSDGRLLFGGPFAQRYKFLHEKETRNRQRGYILSLSFKLDVKNENSDLVNLKK